MIQTLQAAAEHARQLMDEHAGLFITIEATVFGFLLRVRKGRSDDELHISKIVPYEEAELAKSNVLIFQLNEMQTAIQRADLYFN